MPHTEQPPAARVCTVPRCDHPTGHNTTLVCRSCVDGLRADLRELPELLPDLEVTLTRQDVTGGEAIPEPPEEARTKDGERAATTVLMFRPMASDVGQYLREALEHWTRHMLDALQLTEHDAIAPTRDRDARTLELAAWLARHPDGIACDPDGGALVENLRYAIEDVRRVIFPRQLHYVGPCDPECGEQLYAEQGATAVRCKGCRRRWVIAERMVQLREQAEGRFLSAEDMSRALPRLAAGIGMKPLTASQIRGFGARGRLQQYRPDPTTWTVDEQGAPVPPPPRYKVAEVIDLMHALIAEEDARNARHARATSASTRDKVAQAHQRLQEALRA
jgi:hypothetical protein